MKTDTRAQSELAIQIRQSRVLYPLPQGPPLAMQEKSLLQTKRSLSLAEIFEEDDVQRHRKQFAREKENVLLPKRESPHNAPKSEPVIAHAVTNDKVANDEDDFDFVSHAKASTSKRIGKKPKETHLAEWETPCNPKKNKISNTTSAKRDQTATVSVSVTSAAAKRNNPKTTTVEEKKFTKKSAKGVTKLEEAHRLPTTRAKAKAMEEEVTKSSKIKTMQSTENGKAIAKNISNEVLSEVASPSTKPETPCAKKKTPFDEIEEKIAKQTIPLSEVLQREHAAQVPAKEKQAEVVQRKDPEIHFDLQFVTPKVPKKTKEQDGDFEFKVEVLHNQVKTVEKRPGQRVAGNDREAKKVNRVLADNDFDFDLAKVVTGARKTPLVTKLDRFKSPENPTLKTPAPQVPASNVKNFTFPLPPKVSELFKTNEAPCNKKPVLTAVIGEEASKKKQKKEKLGADLISPGPDHDDEANEEEEQEEEEDEENDDKIQDYTDQVEIEEDGIMEIDRSIRTVRRLVQKVKANDHKREKKFSVHLNTFAKDVKKAMQKQTQRKQEMTTLLAKIQSLKGQQKQLQRDQVVLINKAIEIMETQVNNVNFPTVEAAREPLKKTTDALKLIASKALAEVHDVANKLKIEQKKRIM